jgi:hypothetical protein
MQVKVTKYLRLESSCYFLKWINKILEVINVCKDKNLDNHIQLTLIIINLKWKHKYQISLNYQQSSIQGAITTW